MATWQVIESDIVTWAWGQAWLRQYEETLFHACFGDWPYNLQSILKRFGGPASAPAQPGSDGAFVRQSRGFMNQQWDTGIAYHPDTWRALAQILHPGAFTVSFSHPRTQHRLATAQEEAGYLINPALYSYNQGRFIPIPVQLGWVYGSGKPNGTNTPLYMADPDAAIWQGWQHGSPLGPEIEPMIVAQKPYAVHTTTSIAATGAGALNIDFGRRHKVGARFPGNLILTHHPACQYRGLKCLKNPSGSITGNEPSSRAYGKTRYVYRGSFSSVGFQAHGDEHGYEWVPDYDCRHPACVIPRLEQQAGGDKAHYFYQADWSFEVMERLAAADPVFYAGKVGPAERNIGCWDLPLSERRRVNPGGLEREERFAPTWQYNDHPTLKPILLCTWVAGLLLPPPEYAPRRILVPCCGTGSEMAGCLLAGWDEVIGIEQSSKYADLARRRLTEIERWLKWGAADIKHIVRAASTARHTPHQLGLFE